MTKIDDEEETTPIVTKCARDNYKHHWRKANHATSHTKVRNRFQWHEHNTYGNWTCVHLEQSPMMPLKFTTTRIEKPCRQLESIWGNNEQFWVIQTLEDQTWMFNW